MRMMRLGMPILAMWGTILLIAPCGLAQQQLQDKITYGPGSIVAPLPAGLDSDDPEPEPVTSPVDMDDEDLAAPVAAAPPSSGSVSAATPVPAPESVGMAIVVPDWLVSLWRHPVLSTIFVPALVLFLAVTAGALVSVFSGMMMVGHWRRADLNQRRQAVAAVLAMELETRRQAFDVVPMPPGAEAGMSFVSSVMALSRMEPGYHAARGDLYLLPPRLAASVMVHYAAVQRTAAFTHSQSLAAGLRMLQANRIGGNPCPDANTMRAIHQELETAFQGIDKIIQSLKAIAGI